MKKRLFAAFCCVLMAASLFAGCKKEEKKTNTGSVTLAEYEGLRVGASLVEVSQEDIDEQVQYCLEAYGKSEKLEEGTVQEGDTVNIDYVGTIAEGVFEGGSAEAASLEIGSGTFIDGFEDGLVGAKVGDVVTLNLNFGPNYNRTTTVEGSEQEISLLNKDVTFEVTINYITRTKLPEYNDQFVVEYYGDYDLKTTTEFEEYLGQMLRYNLILNEVWADFVEECTVNSYNQAEVDELVTQIVEYYTSLYEQQGVAIEDYLEYMGMTMEEFKEQNVRPAAEDTIKEKMITKQIAKEQGIEVTEEIYQREAKLYMISDGFETIEDLEEYYTKEEIEFSILYDLVTEWIAEHVVIYDDSAEIASNTDAE
ncbi:MAG: hypothetical protein E7269_03165 [Lachnospiraceae bacterium]|nr:hypothetical protein [Lachnospiraceae bacterium]